MPTIDEDWINARIAACKTAIVAFETAISTVGGGAQSYTVDTGQTRMTVTRANLTEARNSLEYWEDRLQYWANKLEGTGRTVAKPAW